MNVRILAAVAIIGVFVFTAAQDIDTLAGDTDVSISSPSDGQVLTYNASVAKWQNKTSPSSPVILTKQSFVNETTDVATTTLFTPTETGDYRLSQYSDSNINANTSIFFQYSWTDETSTKTSGASSEPAIVPLPPICCGGAYAYNSLVIHASAGNPVTFQACVGSAACSQQSVNGTYNTFITVEKL